ncbi:MAG TPA: K(+)-transporting ATPase subunit C [Thermoanaerobaculia bacterium]|jgi:K+-transporting ATPase ATPase C chain
MKTHLLISLRMTVVLVAITCGIYPLVVFGVAQLAFQHQANGSFLERDGHVIGSALIGQSFTSDRFFHSRPSASDYDATASGGTNLGPTSKKLRDAVASAVTSFDAHTNVPADAVTSSASGLDPHISPGNANAQAARVARANGVAVQQIRALIARATEARFLGLFGEPRINVLRLNLAVLEMKRR